MREADAPGRARTMIREERRSVTVLVADLVGSTALSDGLDPEETRLVIGEALGRMVHAVEAFGGTVKDLAGDGCLSLFGAPVAHEDDAERAVLAGLRICREIAAYSGEVARSWGISGLGVRVAVASGPVVVGLVGAGGRTEYGAHGDTVTLAARLQSEAEPGSVLVTADTQRLLGDRFAWSEPRSFSLKGKRAPVTAFEAGQTRRHSQVRRPHELHGPLVGRTEEVRLLELAASELRAGSGGILVISGEPGIGKSRLVAELHDRIEHDTAAGTAAATWIEGRCLSYGESLPYWPFRDLLRDWLGVSSEEPELRVRVALRRRLEPLFGSRMAEVEPYLASLLDLAGESGARTSLDELSPEARQYRTWEVVEELLGALAKDAPLVVVLEDLHWSDGTSLGLAERLLAMTEDAAMLLVLTHRAERDHPSWRLHETADHEFPHRLRTIELRALPGVAERELLAGLVGRATLPEPVERRILAAAEGNPFFLEELVRSLADAGALVRHGIGWRFDHDVVVEVPPTVQQVLLARIDRLSEATRRVLLAAAVLGRRFDLPLLEGLTGDGTARDALRELQRLDLVREARRWPRPEFQFKHVLIQEAAYGTLLQTDRHELHRRAASWLQERFAGTEDEVAGLLALHWLAAGDEASATTFLARAGDQARAMYALDEAIEHYRALLPLLERRGERQQMALVHFKLALALHMDLRFGEANAAYQEGFRLWELPEPGIPRATLRMGMAALPFEGDPPRSHFLQNIQLQMALLDRLVEAWPERTIVPSLAEWWEISDDGLRYRFRLRQGLSWSDGHPLTAQDVEFAVKRNLDRERPGASVAIYFMLEGAQDLYLGRHDDAAHVGVRALDDRHVEFRLVAPAPYFMNVMNRSDAAPHPRHAIQQPGSSWPRGDDAVLSGAFRAVEWTAERLVLERRAESMTPRRGNVRRVELVRTSPEEAAGAWTSHEIDVVNLRALADPTHLEAVAGEHVVRAPAAFTYYLALDLDYPTVADVRVRRALALAMDRERIAAVTTGPFVVAHGGLVPPALHGHTPDICPRYDPDLARSLLREVGAIEPIPVLTIAEHIYERLMAPVVEAWREVGIPIDLRILTLTEYAALESSRSVAAIIPSGWFPGYPDPEYYLRLLLHSEAKDNVAGYRDPDFDRLVERARAERDVRRRLELYHEADRMAVAERIAVIPLAYGRNDAFIKPWVSGWWEYGKAWSSFADLIVDDRSPRAGETRDPDAATTPRAGRT